MTNWSAYTSNNVFDGVRPIDEKRLARLKRAARNLIPVMSNHSDDIPTVPCDYCGGRLIEGYSGRECRECYAHAVAPSR